jgi:hypothetical protein
MTGRLKANDDDSVGESFEIDSDRVEDSDAKSLQPTLNSHCQPLKFHSIFSPGILSENHHSSGLQFLLNF